MIKKGRKFTYAGAKHEIINVSCDMVRTQRTDKPSLVTYWDKKGLEVILKNPDYYQ